MQRLDGHDAATLAARLGVPRVVLFASVESTMDEAHRLGASDAPAGCVVVADAQTAGRGRGGRRWASPAASGLWMTVLERPETDSGLEVLSLRLGLRAAPILAHFAGRSVDLKWPNDLYVGSRKLAGILVEARWRDQRPDWVAIGLGVNIRPPVELPDAIGVRPSATRAQLLEALLPAVRSAAEARGPLTEEELAEFAGRDYARDRALSRPARGVARGITRDGALIIETAAGCTQHRGGSLEIAKEATGRP